MKWDHLHEPNVGQVRSVIPPDCRRRSLIRASLFVVPGFAFYLASAAATIAVPYEWARPILSLLTGLSITFLFLQAHDAAHDSLTPYRWLNGLLGRILFLPSLHPFTGWVHAHNRVHHGWTNFAPTDHVWAPLSKEAYDRLPAWRRALVRLYRWWPGFGLYYAWENLVRKAILPPPDIHNRKQRVWWWLDDLFLVAGSVAIGCASIALARAWNVAASPAWLILWVQIVPFAVAMWFVAFITYLQHTHPRVAWFNDPDEWSFYAGQVQGTTHTRFPSRLNRLIHNIMEHTAHHADPRIPLYHLPPAQSELKATFQGDVLEQIFTIRGFFYAQRVCQLYDFKTHRWLNYRGEPTSSRTLQLRPKPVEAKSPAAAALEAPAGTSS